MEKPGRGDADGAAPEPPLIQPGLPSSTNRPLAAIESCDRRIRPATLDHHYLHLLAQCHLCAKVSPKVDGRLREKCRHE